MNSKSLRRVLAVGVAFGALVFLLPVQTAAQQKQTEVSGGWSYIHEPDTSIPAGWYASVGRYVNQWFGIVGEVNGHYKTVSESGVDVKTNLHVFGVGPRFAYRGYPRITPFVDLLVGGQRASVGIGGSSANTSATDFAYQSNWGLAINNGDGSLGLRVSVGDYGIRSNGKWTNNSLFEAGVVLRP